MPGHDWSLVTYSKRRVLDLFVQLPAWMGLIDGKDSMQGRRECGTSYYEDACRIQKVETKAHVWEQAEPSGLHASEASVYPMQNNDYFVLF
jgi:hypothetical protein